MNKVFLRGVLTKDVDLKKSQSGNSIAKFYVAIRRDFKNANGEYDSDFISCVAYNKMADTINTYFHKGSGIIVLGHIQTGSYDGQDGKKVYTTDVVVETIEFDRNSKDEKKEEKKEEPKVEKKGYSNDPFIDMGVKVSAPVQESYPWD